MRGMSVDDVILEIERLLDEAKPVPLTKHVRFDPRAMRELLERLKAEIKERERWG